MLNSTEGDINKLYIWKCKSNRTFLTSKLTIANIKINVDFSQKILTCEQLFGII